MENNDKNRIAPPDNFDSNIEKVKESEEEVNLALAEEGVNMASEEEKFSDTAEKENNKPAEVDAFLSSSSDMTPENIDSSETDDQKEKNKLGWRSILLAIFLAIFIVSAGMIAFNLIDSYRAKKFYSEMNSDFLGDSDRTGLISYLAPAVLDKEMPKYGNVRLGSGNGEYSIIDTNNPFFAQYKEKLTEYQKTNPDIFCWIQVDGTGISYACVKGTDNNYYLDHNVMLEQNVNGAIFADYRCDTTILENPNLVLYGHNMIQEGVMFTDMLKFLDQTTFLNNRYITIYTVDAVYRYEIFAVYRTKSTYRYCQIGFMSAESFVDWCDEMIANSMYKRNTKDFTENSRVLTLSTCVTGDADGRYALQARLVSIEKSADTVIELPDGDEFNKVNQNTQVPLDELELPLMSEEPEDTTVYPESETVVESVEEPTL
ncbi:MAG: class B sortase [Clostridia bacterium]|nr:class B sortase [Clostridia bacterium]